MKTERMKTMTKVLTIKFCRCTSGAKETRLWKHDRTCPRYDATGCQHRFLGTKDCIYCKVSYTDLLLSEKGKSNE